MARPKSDDKRTAILDAAAAIIEKQGLSAPTAAIAKQAGVASGSLFTYFPNKADLFNQLYLELKTDMAMAATAALPPQADLREQFAHVWMNWLRWAQEFPQKKRVLAQLGMFDELLPKTREAGHQAMAEIAALMQQARGNGTMRDVPFGLVAGMMNAIAEATMDFVAQHPKEADQHTRAGFEAFWRMLS